MTIGRNRRKAVYNLIQSYVIANHIGANRRYSEKHSAFAGQRSNWLRQLGTIRSNRQEHNEAPDRRDIQARVVTDIHYRVHIMLTLKRLHWIPIKFRINFETKTLTFTVRFASILAHVASLISSYHHGRSLCSADHNRLTVLHVENCRWRESF